MFRTPAVKIETSSGSSYYISPEHAERARERQKKRDEARQMIALNRAVGDGKGWNVAGQTKIGGKTRGPGFPQWQLIEGGRFQPLL